MTCSWYINSFGLGRRAERDVRCLATCWTLSREAEGRVNVEEGHLSLEDVQNLVYSLGGVRISGVV